MGNREKVCMSCCFCLTNKMALKADEETCLGHYIDDRRVVLDYGGPSPRNPP